jgi:urease gamma subunit
MKKLKNVTELTDLAVKREGKKVGINRAQWREAIAVISDILFEYNNGCKLIYGNGKRRAKRKK